MMEKKSSLTTNNAVKVLLTVIIIGAFVALAFLLLRQSKTGDYNWSKSGQAVKVQDLAKIRADYSANYRQLMQAYLNQDLSGSRLLSQELLSQTSQAKNGLLGFLVPPEAKEQHLSTILALDGVVDGINKQDAAAVSASIDKLKELAGKI